VTAVPPRLCDLAEAAGVSPSGLRRYIAVEIDRRVRGNARVRARSLAEEDLRLFVGDVGYVGSGARTLSAAAAERAQKRGVA